MVQQNTQGQEAQHEVTNGDLAVNNPSELEGVGETALASVADWKPVVATLFPSLVPVVEACMATCCALLLSDLSGCPALVLEGQASSLKTTALEFFDTDFVYGSDNFTPAAFVSHAANIKKEELAKIDLLPRLKHKLWVVKDLAPIFSKRADDLSEAVGVLTRILDGRGYRSDTGAQGQRGYTGDYRFGLLAATTPLDSRIWKVMSRLGPRFLFRYIDTGQQSDEEQLNKLLAGDSYADKVEVCRAAVSGYLKWVWEQHNGFGGMDWGRQADDEELAMKIVHLAKLGIRLRSQLARQKENFDGSTEFIPAVIEGPDRFRSQLYNLARGHAIAEGRTRLAYEDVKLAATIALRSGPTDRRGLLRAVLASEDPISIADAQVATGCSNYIVLGAAREMVQLGILTAFNDEGTQRLSPAAEHECVRNFLGGAGAG